MMISITDNIWDKDALNEFLYLFTSKITPLLSYNKVQNKIRVLYSKIREVSAGDSLNVHNEPKMTLRNRTKNFK